MTQLHSLMHYGDQLSLLDMGDRRAHAGANGMYEVHLANEEHNTCEMSVDEWKMRENCHVRSRGQ